MPKKHFCNCIAYASGVGAGDSRSDLAPSILQKAFNQHNLSSRWIATLQPTTSVSGKAALPEVVALSQKLAGVVYDLVQAKETFIVMGGDHTTAIGTWTGAAEALRPKGDIGLIWIDAHMDSHTPETTPSQNIHGMPVATLLGYGYPELTHILSAYPALKPHNLCLIGVRSYEPEEPTFLSELGVRVFFMDEVKQRGLNVVMEEALQIVRRQTVGYGISLDVDAFDPNDFPATGIQVPDGLLFSEVYQCFQTYVGSDEMFLGIDMAEFIPVLDLDSSSEGKLVELVKIIFPLPLVGEGAVPSEVEG